MNSLHGVIMQANGTCPRQSLTHIVSILQSLTHIVSILLCVYLSTCRNCSVVRYPPPPKDASRCTSIVCVLPNCAPILAGSPCRSLGHYGGGNLCVHRRRVGSTFVACCYLTGFTRAFITDVVRLLPCWLHSCWHLPCSPALTLGLS